MLTDTLFLLFLVLFVSVDYVKPRPVKEDHPFDFLIFTQEWPLTLCKEWKQHNSSIMCNFSSNPDSWTIHGVWPTNFHTKGPEFCNISWHFDPEAVRTIEAPLTELWTNIEGNTEVYSLWTHEWTKHGTCAAMLEPLNSEFKYFTNGLSWMKTYTMQEILKLYNILPSNDKEYPIAEIHKAVTDKLGVNPAIKCKNIEGNNWLAEIRICFSKTLELSNCDGIIELTQKHAPGITGLIQVLTNCDVNKNIYYPKDIAPEQ